jgi:hypothetical protein
MNPPPKSIFKSKTAFAGSVATVSGALGTFFPSAVPFVTANAPAILMLSGALAVIIRFATKGRVVLFAE